MNSYLKLENATKKISIGAWWKSDLPNFLREISFGDNHILFLKHQNYKNNTTKVFTLKIIYIKLPTKNNRFQ